MSDDGADWQQQSELEELYAWFKEQNEKFEEIFLGGKANEHEQDTE
jgi:hypothetical protein